MLCNDVLVLNRKFQYRTFTDRAHGKIGKRRMEKFGWILIEMTNYC